MHSESLLNGVSSDKHKNQPCFSALPCCKLSCPWTPRRRSRSSIQKLQIHQVAILQILLIGNSFKAELQCLFASAHHESSSETLQNGEKQNVSRLLQQSPSSQNDNVFPCFFDVLFFCSFTVLVFRCCCNLQTLHFFPTVQIETWPKLATRLSCSPLTPSCFVTSRTTLEIHKHHDGSWKIQIETWRTMSFGNVILNDKSRFPQLIFLLTCTEQCFPDKCQWQFKKFSIDQKKNENHWWTIHSDDQIVTPPQTGWLLESAFHQDRECIFQPWQFPLTIAQCPLDQRNSQFSSEFSRNGRSCRSVLNWHSEKRNVNGPCHPAVNDLSIDCIAHASKTRKSNRTRNQTARITWLQSNSTRNVETTELQKHKVHGRLDAILFANSTFPCNSPQSTLFQRWRNWFLQIISKTRISPGMPPPWGAHATSAGACKKFSKKTSGRLSSNSNFLVFDRARCGLFSKSLKWF